ncbi:MAG: AAA family ATPase [Spirochaetales bacterium]|uniref:Replication-associated recombination protein A n=1 Tax=Candidatus Thalassospirochaeta sargassi TaxID=3119039 RepID=A0AAJ1MJ02_9SPIO|nr:AAA family ATPase [Spirochaetales bacterium]
MTEIKSISYRSSVAVELTDITESILLAQPHTIIYTSAMELFSQTDSKEAPLAFRMRPRNMDEFIGQDHIAGPGRLLRRIIQADRMSSIIFYGPPGTGKTTLARVIANTTSSSFITMNAVLDGVKNLRDAIAEAQNHRDLYDRKTILFVDEVHRWNKSQQDALLPWVENGTVILIGATTENPYFEVNKALVSRSRIFQLKPLTPKNLHDIAMQAVNDVARGYGRVDVKFVDGALEHLIETSNGDARSLLNAVELAVETSADIFPPAPDSPITVNMETAEESIQKKALLYDKEGDYHYDTISAFIKSIRGSDPDAALYWLATMVRAGEEPRYIFRRMLISASEDVGLADPQALGVVEAAAAAFDRVGLPEGRFHLTQAALYLATAPKSNTTLSFFDALGAVEQEFAKEVPNHLKDAGRDREGFGHGDGYLYPHAYKDHWVAQQYLPTGLQGRMFYEPSGQGYEAAVRERLLRQREIQLAVVTEDQTSEVLTFSPPDKGAERWLYRLNRESGRTLTTIRDRVFDKIDSERPAADAHVTGSGQAGEQHQRVAEEQPAGINRHDCLLVLEPAVPVFLWEAVRRTPEGSVYYLPAGERVAEICRHYAESLPLESRPIELPPGSCEADIKEFLPEGLLFETILCRDRLTSSVDRIEKLKIAGELLKPGGCLVINQFIPTMAQRISDLPELAILESNQGLLSALRSAEEDLYNSKSNPLVNWNAGNLISDIAKAGFSTDERIEQSTYLIEEKRPISSQQILKWFDSDANGYGGILSGKLPQAEFEKLRTITAEALNGKIVSWNLNFILLRAVKKIK